MKARPEAKKSEEKEAKSAPASKSPAPGTPQNFQDLQKQVLSLKGAKGGPVEALQKNVMAMIKTGLEAAQAAMKGDIKGALGKIGKLVELGSKMGDLTKKAEKEDPKTSNVASSVMSLGKTQLAMLSRLATAVAQAMIPKPGKSQPAPQKGKGQEEEGPEQDQGQEQAAGPEAGEEAGEEQAAGPETPEPEPEPGAEEEPAEEETAEQDVGEEQEQGQEEEVGEEETEDQDMGDDMGDGPGGMDGPGMDMG